MVAPKDKGMRIAGGIVALVAGVIALLITLAPVVFEETSSTAESLETLIFKAPPDKFFRTPPDSLSTAIRCKPHLAFSRCEDETFVTAPQFGGFSAEDNGDFFLIIPYGRQWILWSSLIISGLVVLLGATALGSNSLAPAWLLPIIAIVGAPFAIVPMALLMPLVFIGGFFVFVDAQGGIKGTIPCLILLCCIGIPVIAFSLLYFGAFSQ